MSDNKQRPSFINALRYMVAFYFGLIAAAVVLWIAGFVFPQFPFKLQGPAILGFVAGGLLGGTLIYSFYRRTGQQ